MSNRRFPKVFVIDPVNTMFITDNTKKPSDLTAKQVGFFLVDQFGIPGVGTGATPGATVPRIEIHQNVGDNKFGTVHSKTIERAMVRRYYGEPAGTGQTAIAYIGYDTVDASKDIAVPCGQEFALTLMIGNNKLVNWYNHNPGYRKTIVVNTGCCPVGQPNATADKDTLADFIVAAINGTGAPANDYKAGNELPNFVVATKVTTGTQGQDDYRVGVKVESVAITPDLLNACDPIKFAEVNTTQIAIAFDGGRLCNFTVPVTDSRVAKAGKGYPAFLAAEEAESQGYDRVREVYENPRYMKLADYVILAADGKKYDSIFLEFDWSHPSSVRGATSGIITEPYIVKISAPTTTLQAVADVLNSWLTGLFPAVTIANGI